MGQYGKAIISPLPYYETNDNYFPHDYFIREDLEGFLDTAVFIKSNSGLIQILNKYNDGFSGHEIRLKINSNLEIKEASYDHWSDVIIPDTKSEYLVEKVILSFENNPFNNKYPEARYVLQIRQDIYDTRTDARKGPSAYEIFKGKFKVYTDKERQMGRDQVIHHTEIKYGIKDSAGIYHFTDLPAEFEYGADSLKNTLAHIKIDRKEACGIKRSYVVVRMVIDEFGKADPNSIEFRDEVVIEGLLYNIRHHHSLLSNWRPAYYNGRPVKSEINLPVQIKR